MNKHFIFSVVTIILSSHLIAQPISNPQLTAQDYARAEQMLYYNTAPLVDNAVVRANWLGNNRFWYRNLTQNGSEFIVADAARKTKAPAFDQQKLATALSAATGKTYNAYHLPFQTFMFSDDGKSISFTAEKNKWTADLSTYTITEQSATTGDSNGHVRRYEVLSPDGKKAVFIKDWNLWLRDTESNKETQLTTDGVANFGYATDNAGWTHSDYPIVRWSPDNKKLATFQQDQRHVADMYLVTTNVGAPTLQQWKYPLPGDSAVAMIHRVIIEVDNPKVIRLQVPPDPHRATLSDDISSGGDGLDDVDWSEDGSQLAFVSTSRDHKVEKLRIADAATGAVREVFEENSPTQFESGQGKINWRFLPGSNEIIWYSERDDWGHLYLVDANTGQFKTSHYQRQLRRYATVACRCQKSCGLFPGKWLQQRRKSIFHAFVQSGF